MGSTAISVIGIGILALLLGGYIAQNRLPPPKPKIIGIDFGTTYSGIAVYESISASVRVIKDSKGRKTIPSVIHYRSHDDIIIGHEALENTERDSLNVIYDSKRFIGRNISKDDLEKESSMYNFKILKNEDNVCFEVLSNSNKTCITPEQVASYIIRHLKVMAENDIDRPIKMAVMSVPADFDQAQRNFTKYAAKLAGIDVLRTINEPTAAALAYGLDKRKGVNFILVVDIGGGTSDISLLNIQGGMFVTVAMAGNNHLGGQDFNENLFRYIMNEITSEFSGEWKSDSENYQKLRIAVEKLKLDLSLKQASTLKVKLTLNRDSSEKRTVEYIKTVTRKQFENLNDNLYIKVKELIQAVLTDAEMSHKDIDEVVLVGGSTRMPKIRQIIAKFFNKLPNTSIDPDCAVMHGVALQAGIIGGNWPLLVSAIEIQRNVKRTQLK